jgi:hypothetical protein
MRIVPPTLPAFVVMFAVSAQAIPTSKDENWRPLPTTPLSFSLGDQACGYGFHQALWRDWRGEWWWGPCVPNR